MKIKDDLDEFFKDEVTALGHRRKIESIMNLNSAMCSKETSTDDSSLMDKSTIWECMYIKAS